MTDNPLSKLTDRQVFDRDPATWLDDPEALEEAKKRITKMMDRHRKVREDAADPFNYSGTD